MSSTLEIVIAMSEHKAGRLPEAERGYRRVLAESPDHPAALHGLGMLCHQTGRAAEAIGLLRKTVESAPGWGGCRSSLAAVLGSLGRHREAAELLREAVSLEPGNAVAHNNLGVALEKIGRAAAAVDAYEKAIALRPDYAAAHNNLGNALRAEGRLAQAEAAHRESIRLSPDYAPAFNSLAGTLRALGRADDAVACYRKLVELQPRSAAAGSDLLLSLHYLDGVGPEEMLAEHVRWAERHAAPLSAAARPHTPRGTADADRPLRIGYVSPDFREYPAVRFFEPLLAAHDRRTFEIFCYSDVRRPDATTVRLRAHGDTWRDIAGLSDQRVEQLIRDDRIDILVDLAGHLANPRLLLFARKPAPVQASYLGYPETTGLTTIDYRISDPWHDPPGMTEPHHTEQLVRLPRCCWSYAPEADLPPVGGLPAEASRQVTFGVMNRLVKVTPKMIAVWARILSLVPASRLLVLVAQGAEREPSVRARFTNAGIDTGRLLLVAQRPRREYLDLFTQVDVGLDTFPYAGMTTTCDGLWMGVPTVTLAGKTHVSRTGASLMTAVGLAELIAATPEEYVEIAVRLAGDLPRLSGVRAELRERVRRSSLNDGAGLAAAVETGYRWMWRTWCSGRR